MKLYIKHSMSTVKHIGLEYRDDGTDKSIIINLWWRSIVIEI